MPHAHAHARVRTNAYAHARACILERVHVPRASTAHTYIRLVSVPLRRRATHVHAHAYVYAPLQARHAPSQLPSGLPFRCTQGPGDLLLLPPLWGHATKNLGFNIGIGDLYCDSRLANQARK